MTEEKTPKKTKDPVYSKAQFLQEKNLGADWVIIAGLLEDEKQYTRSEVKKIVENFKRKKVHR